MYTKKPIAERFWKKVKRTDACWRWIASLDIHGYGKFGVNHKIRGAHRVAWELTNGEIPKGLGVLHRCDVPACVRPSHLFLGTQSDNLRDMINKQRRIYPSKVGAQNINAKLTSVQVEEIRVLYLIGLTPMEMARYYKIGWSAVDRILKGKSWVTPLRGGDDHAEIH